MPVVSNNRQENFSDDRTFSAASSAIPENKKYQAESSIPIIDTSDLVGKYFLMSARKDSQRLRVKIVKVLDSHQDYLNSNAVLKEFVVDDTVEEIMSCNEILDHMQNQDYQDQIKQRFNHVASHEVPLPRNLHS